jgi:hypothetical protein
MDFDFICSVVQIQVRRLNTAIIFLLPVDFHNPSHVEDDVCPKKMAGTEVDTSKQTISHRNEKLCWKTSKKIADRRVKLSKDFPLVLKGELVKSSNGCSKPF